MENNIIEKYELSVWEDVVLSKNEEYLDEQKIAIIGASGWDSPIKAYNVTLTENINGEKTLTFNILRKYRNDKGELMDNPFIPILTNERKIKLRIGEPYNFYNDKGVYDDTIPIQEDKEDRWIDFLIKTVDENKKSYVNTFTCKEAYVTELGKNGYATTLKTELENNYGTLNELAARILEHSGWTIGSNYIPKEYSKEILFIPVQTQANTKVSITKMVGNNTGAGKKVNQLKLYAFYSELENIDGEWHLTTDKPQVYYKEDGFSTDDADDERVIIDENDEYNYLVTDTNGISTDLVWTPLDSGIQGKRIVESNVTHYESVNNRYVTDYKVIKSVNGAKVGAVVYGYETAEYLNSESVQNYVTNSSNFVSTTGWLSDDDVDAKDLITYPNSTKASGYAKNCLIIKNNSKKTTRVWNSGLIDRHITIEENKKYVIRFRARAVNLNKGKVNPKNEVDLTLPTEGKLYVGIRDWNKRADSDSNYGFIKGMKFLVKYPNTSESTASNYTGYGFVTPVKKEERLITINKCHADEAGYTYVILQAGESISATNMHPVGVTISTTKNNSQASWLFEDIQFFEYKEQQYNGHMIPLFPGDLPEATYNVETHFYTVNNGNTVILPAKPNNYQVCKRSNYAAVRHLEIEKSNYFNNINSLAELFEVWVGYRVAHQKDGKIFKVNGQPKKQVIFSKFSPFDQENWAGFKYGINVDDIKRNTVSDSISTKIIVNDNVNEFAKDGICSIVRASDNISGERNLFNFDYYVNQGLLSQSQMTYDLYNAKNGYLAKLGKINKDLLPLNEKIQTIITDGDRYEEYYNQYSAAMLSLSSEIDEQQRLVESAEGLDNTPYKEGLEQTLKTMKARKNSFQKGLNGYLDKANECYKKVYGNSDKTITYQGFWNSANSYSEGTFVRIGSQFYKAKQTNVNKKPTGGNDDKYWETSTKTKASKTLYNKSLVLSDDKRILDEQFYKKYSRFIQEGTWSDSSYINDNSYFFDAKKILAQSAYPKVTYTISVVDISGIKKYAGYTFKVGQRTYLEDTDFFGWIYTDSQGVEDLGNWKTPFKKEVIISERTRNFDDASKSKITVQTYRNQWKDLFSKLTAATQTLSFNSGGYQRAANLVDETGQLKVNKVLEALNKINTTSQKIESVTTTSGFTVNMGENLYTGVTINSLVGQIDVDTINITSAANDYAFTWDAAGLNAYLKNASNKNQGIDGQVYVRYNNLGIYGTSKGEQIDTALNLIGDKNEAEKIKAIKDYTTFFLTWDGLYLNSDNGNLKLDPQRGLEIYSGVKWPLATLKSYDYIYDGLGEKYTKNDAVPLVTLGRLGLPYSAVSPVYGLRLRNNDGYITMETSNTGNLILRNQLRVGEFGAERNYTHQVEETAYILKTYNRVNDEFGGYIDYVIYRITLKNTPAPNTVVTVANITNDFNNPVIEFNVGADSHTPSNDWNYDAESNTYWTSRQIDQFSQQEINPIPISNGFYFTHYIITETIMPYVGLNGDGIGDNPIVFYAGYSPAFETTKSSEYEKAPFKIHADGTFIAKRANITGTINATDGYFSGAIKIGNTAGINGDSNSAYVFYAGNGDSTEPTFSVSPNGQMIANDSMIRGNSTIEGTIFANQGRINRLFLNNSPEDNSSITSYIGANTGIEGRSGESDAGLVYINIHAGDFAVDNRGYFYGEKLFLVRNTNWYGIGHPDFTQSTALNYGDYYNIVVGPNQIIDENENYTSYFFTVYNPNTEINNKNLIFGVRDNGSIEMAGTLFANGLDLTGALKVHGEDDSNRIVIDGDNGRIYANNDFGDVWWVNKDGSAEFNNVKARGKIATTVFEYDKISAVGGNIAITPSAFLVEECISTVIIDGKNGFETVSTDLDLWHDGDDVLVSVLVEKESELEGQVSEEVYIHGSIITIKDDLNDSSINTWSITRSPTSINPQIDPNPPEILSIKPSVISMENNQQIVTEYKIIFNGGVDEDGAIIEKILFLQYNTTNDKWVPSGELPLWDGNDEHIWVSTQEMSVSNQEYSYDDVTKILHFSWRGTYQVLTEQWDIAVEEIDKNYLILHDAPSNESDVAQALNRIYHIVPEFIDGRSYATLPKGTSLININLTHNSISLSAMQPAGSTIYMTSNDGDSFKSTMIGFLDPTRISENSIFKSILEEQTYYGLYSQSAFIEGRVYLPKAGITNEELQVLASWDGTGDVDQKEKVTKGTGSEVRIWAGAGYADMQNAPFIVTQDGTLYASQGVFKGKIEASDSEFSGHIKASGVLLGNKETPDFSHFYYAWAGDDIDNSNIDTDVHNYIADFNRYGLNMWDSLTIFSRYYNGFYKDDNDNWIYSPDLYTATEYTKYGYDYWNDNTNQADFIKKGYWRDNACPFPIFTILDRTKDLQTIQPRISATNLQLWAASDNSFYNVLTNPNPSPIYGINLNSDHITFTKYSIPIGGDSDDSSSININNANYDTIADALWNPSDENNKLFSIGHIYLGDLNNTEIIGAVTNTFTFANATGQSAMIIHNDTKNSVIVGSQTKDVLNFSDKIQIEIENNGITFNYIGGE